MATPTTLPATFVAGNVLTAAQMNNLRGAFRVLQVVQGSTTTAGTNATITFADSTLTATITPQSTSSLILVTINQNVGKKAGNADSGCVLQILRGATVLGTSYGPFAYTGTNILLQGFSASMQIIDTPASVSALTYKTQFSNNLAADGAQVQCFSSRSTITLMEISA